MSRSQGSSRYLYIWKLSVCFVTSLVDFRFTVAENTSCIPSFKVHWDPISIPQVPTTKYHGIAPGSTIADHKIIRWLIIIGVPSQHYPRHDYIYIYRLGPTLLPYIFCLIVLLSYLITLLLSAQIDFDCSEKYIIISRGTQRKGIGCTKVRAKVGTWTRARQQPIITHNGITRIESYKVNTNKRYILLKSRKRQLQQSWNPKRATHKQDSVYIVFSPTKLCLWWFLLSLK